MKKRAGEGEGTRKNKSLDPGPPPGASLVSVLMLAPSVDLAELSCLASLVATPRAHLLLVDAERDETAGETAHCDNDANDAEFCVVRVIASRALGHD